MYRSRTYLCPLWSLACHSSSCLFFGAVKQSNSLVLLAFTLPHVFANLHVSPYSLIIFCFAKTQNSDKLKNDSDTCITPSKCWSVPFNRNLEYSARAILITFTLLSWFLLGGRVQKSGLSQDYFTMCHNHEKYIYSLMTCNQLLQTHTSSVNTSKKNPICNSSLTVGDYVVEMLYHNCSIWTKRH